MSKQQQPTSNNRATRTEIDEGKATRAEMAALWSSCLSQLLERVKAPKVTAEILTVSRAFLKDSSYTNPKVNSRGNQRLLEQLDCLYREKLMAGLADGIPSVGLLTEARMYRLELEQYMALDEGFTQLQSIPVNTPFKQ